MSGHDTSAVVLGASISGLLFARVLSRHFQRVTLVERDVLPERALLRDGTPQDRHAHGLLPAGYRLIEGYFPGIMQELEGLGAQGGDITGDFLWFLHGRWKLRHRCGVRGITVSRAALETAIRRRVKALPNVTFMEDTEGLRPVFDPAVRRVTGLVVRPCNGNADQTLPADVVVDASGRGSRSPAWLAEWGYGEPEARSVKIDLCYATRAFERRPGDFPSRAGASVAPVPPGGTRGAFVLAAEEGRWLVSLGGMGGDYPPADEEGWNKFAASLPVPEVHKLVTSARPLSDIATFRVPAYRRLFYEHMPEFPEGYVVVGDAICTLNPLYAPGMSVAAAEAQLLDQAIATGMADLGRRFFAGARKLIDAPWGMAKAADLCFPYVEGERSLGLWLLNKYIDQVQASASVDAAVCAKLFEVIGLVSPPTSLMSPAVAWRVLARRPPQGIGSPRGLLGESTEGAQRAD